MDLKAVRLRVRKLDVALYVRIRSLARTRDDVRWVRRFSTAGEMSGLWLAIGGAGVLLARGRRRAWLRATLSVAAAHGTSTAIKALVRRRRPALAHLPHLMSTPTGLSFPSSHATGSFAAARVYTPLLPRRRGAAELLYATATAMALSRVLLGVHYPTDIAAGAALGAVVGSIGRSHGCR